jgi:hypothetical protein
MIVIPDRPGVNVRVRVTGTLLAMGSAEWDHYFEIELEDETYPTLSITTPANGVTEVPLGGPGSRIPVRAWR